MKNMLDLKCLNGYVSNFYNDKYIKIEDDVVEYYEHDKLIEKLTINEIFRYYGFYDYLVTNEISDFFGNKNNEIYSFIIGNIEIFFEIFDKYSRYYKILSYSEYKYFNGWKYVDKYKTSFHIKDYTVYANYNDGVTISYSIRDFDILFYPRINDVIINLNDSKVGTVEEIYFLIFHSNNTELIEKDFKDYYFKNRKYLKRKEILNDLEI